jgi:hypothetical protein
MTMNKHTFIFAMATVIGTAMLAAPASAEGFFAGALKRAGVINEQQREALDRGHEVLGKPLDKAAEEAKKAAQENLDSLFDDD